MRKLTTALRAGVAAVATVGFAGIALAQSPQTHIMTVPLPGGGVAHIRYAGPIAPQVTIGNTPAPLLTAMPALFASGSPFAEMERISAAMDRQAARLLNDAAAVAVQPALTDTAAFHNLPAGAREYSFVSTMSGNGVCSRSVEITSLGNGAPAKIVRHSSGDCGTAAMGGSEVPTQQRGVPVPENGPKMIMTKATGVRAPAARLQEAALR